MRIWLKEIRVSQNKTQDRIASEIGKTRQYYSAIENGTRGNPLPVPIAQKIAAALGFDWQRFY